MADEFVFRFQGGKLDGKAFDSTWASEELRHRAKELIEEDRVWRFRKANRN